MSDERFPMAWPDVPRLCFGEGSPAHLNACVGWVQTRPDGMLGYVEGYRNAAVALFEASVEKPVSPDFLVFPLAFLWRHHVELALKDIIAIGRQLAGQPWGFPEHHRLLALWKEARPYVIECGDPSAPEPANVESNIQEFETIDPAASGFRYPLGRGLSTRTLNPPKYVNLRVLHEGMEAVANLLSGVRSELGVRLDYMTEAEAAHGYE